MHTPSKVFTFNCMTTVQVVAEDYDEAISFLQVDGNGIENQLIDMDIQLVDTLCLHNGYEDASDCDCAPDIFSL